MSERCRYCGGGAVNILEHELNCVARGDHGAYATDRRSGKDRRTHDPHAPNAPYRRMGPRRSTDKRDGPGESR